MYSAIPPTTVHSELPLEQAVDLTTARPRLWQQVRVFKQDAASTVMLMVNDEMSVVVKRQRLNTWRRRADALLHGSPAHRSWKGAHRLRLLGFPAPRPLAVLERRAAGIVWECVYVSAVLPYPRLDAYWRERAPQWSMAQRRRFVRALATFVRCFHATGLYTGDLRDANLLVAQADPEARHWRFCLVDLDRIRRPFVVSRRRRFKNLVQLDRTAGRAVRRTERLIFLYEYLGGRPSARKRRAILRRLLRLRARKDREYTRRQTRPRLKPLHKHLLRQQEPTVHEGRVRPRRPISCCIVCFNEERNIRRCLRSVMWCDEIIVVDSFSTDRTVDICRNFPLRLIQRPWPGYAEQKGFAIAQARHDWVIYIDADEEISPALKDEIEAVLQREELVVDGFYIPRLVHYLGRWWRRGWYPGYRLRMFRKSKTRVEGPNPHEKVFLDGCANYLHHDIHHYTYGDISDHLRRMNSFTDWVPKNPRIKRRGCSLSALLCRPAWRFLRLYVVQGCVWYGVAGFFMSVTAGVYVFLKYAKLREHLSGAAPESSA